MASAKASSPPSYRASGPKDGCAELLDLLQLAVGRAFTNPADAAEPSVPDRQGIRVSAISGPINPAARRGLKAAVTSYRAAGSLSPYAANA